MKRSDGSEGQRSRVAGPKPDSVMGWSPFHVAANDYLQAGYLPIPLPAMRKGAPPMGTPNELIVNEDKLNEWLAINRPRNIGTIVPDGTVVFDIDGAAARETLKEIENQYGKLPETWYTYRGDVNRYHLWYSAPGGLTWPGRLAPGIDVIYRHYRYMVLPPSIHPDGGQYRWATNRTGVLKPSQGYFPEPDEFVDLPESWLVLANGRGYVHRERAIVDCRLWMDEHGKGDMCPEMKRVRNRWLGDISEHVELGRMHDSVDNAVWSLVAEIK